MRTVEGGKAVSILGFCGVKIGDVDDFLRKVKVGVHPAGVQILDAARVAGNSHLFFAFLNAQRSFEQGQAISDNLEMETLLYASGQRQINRAIEMLGVKPQTSSIATIIFASDEREVEDAENKLAKLVSGVWDDSVLEVKGNGKIEGLMKVFEVTELELKTMAGSGTTLDEALTWFIVEMGSLLSTKR